METLQAPKFNGVPCEFVGRLWLVHTTRAQGYRSSNYLMFVNYWPNYVHDHCFHGIHDLMDSCVYDSTWCMCESVLNLPIFFLNVCLNLTNKGWKIRVKKNGTLSPFLLLFEGIKLWSPRTIRELREWNLITIESPSIRAVLKKEDLHASFMLYSCKHLPS